MMSETPLSDIDFFDTHDILTIFHLMQYIAIFSRYFPSVNWPKIIQNFIPGARMLTFSRQNGLFTITSGFFRDKMAYLPLLIKLRFFLH